MGLELVDQAPDADAFDYIMVPCGGAGLLAGVALASKTLRPGAPTERKTDLARRS